MRKVFHTLALLALLTLPCAALAAGAPATSDHYTQNGFNPRMIDTSVSQAERIKLFAQLITLANQGQARAQELAGTMYWQGQKLPGSPVQQDLKQARILLANAAIQGDVSAMAKLGELELGSGRTTEAMIWAQMYAHYLNPLKSIHATRGRNFAYATDLIDRIIKAGGKDALNDKVSRSFNVLVVRFDKKIRQGLDAFREQARSGDPRLISFPVKDRLTGDDSKLSGQADFIVAFDASGAPTQTWLVASYPTPRIAALTRPSLETIRSNPADDGSRMRYLQLHMTLNGNKKRYLRMHH